MGGSGAGRVRKKAKTCQRVTCGRTMARNPDFLAKTKKDVKSNCKKDEFQTDYNSIQIPIEKASLQYIKEAGHTQ